MSKVRIAGTVKWFDIKKGYGFLNDQDGNDVFVHYTAIKDEGFKALYPGDQVEFSIVDGKKGPQADEVIVMASAGDDPEPKKKAKNKGNKKSSK